MSLVNAVSSSFQEAFGHAPELLVRAPGRVNLIGEHTDYNGGFVLPAAIDKEIYFAVAPNALNRIRLVAHDKHQRHEVALTQDLKPGPVPWANYLLGVVAQLQARGAKVGGFDCVFGGNIPMGAGLSSSAAVECGLAFALNQMYNLGFPPLALAQIAQQAEHTFAGVQCGLMDQFASLMSRAGHVVRLDCRSLQYEYFPFDTTAAQVVLCNSGVKHNLADSEYNIRRGQCEQGVAVVRQHYPQVQTLRNVTRTMLEEHRAALDAVVYRRCRYVIAENERVLTACAFLEAGNLAAFGQEMYASHAGLRDDYEVSCQELDVLVDLARAQRGVFGARMMGGGFGGCTINLIEPAHVPAFQAAVAAGFSARFNRPLEMYQATIVAGVSAVPSLAAAQ
ncbi:galactokinase [Hymenobacter lutimineralis]|uniref:Galactokinase n=1 Tax=Hymenobacter lutimineralis TaxID=2606448 RepID=A0A5D6V8T9_9BACT|nr:galactokinase [Hymenobacter lutimineralis]TYZ11378.1 galactokinase [Hymenobacter lutimineralis]